MKRKCQNCNNTLRKGWTTCPVCGESIPFPSIKFKKFWSFSSTLFSAVSILFVLFSLPYFKAIKQNWRLSSPKKEEYANFFYIPPNFFFLLLCVQYTMVNTSASKSECNESGPSIVFESRINTT